MNFVLLPWAPLLDPYSTLITRVDQWVRIPRLPWELWDSEYLTASLLHVGVLVKLDHNTLYRLKDKFARVCINIDITKPLPGSLSITHKEGCLRVPLIYEGLHEVCPLCGGESHLLEACPKLPTSKKVEVVVEKFESSTNINVPSMPATLQNPPSSTDSWVTICPKQRVKAMISVKPRRNSMLNPERGWPRRY